MNIITHVIYIWFIFPKTDQIQIITDSISHVDQFKKRTI